MKLPPKLFVFSLAVTIVIVASDLQASTEDWPRFRGAQGNGSWNPPSLPADLTTLEPKQLWSQKVGGGYGGVTVSDGRVYLMDRQTTPEEVERVLCFEAKSGEPLWTHAYPVRYENLSYGNGPRASVTIHDGKAYTLGARGMALCLDAKTGAMLWQKDTMKDSGAEIPEWGFAASAYIWQDTIFLHVGAKPSGTILALEASTGRERWRAGDDPAGYCTPFVIEQQGQPQLIQWSPLHVLSFNPNTGAENWRFPYKIQYGVSIAQPIFHENILLVSGYWHGTRALRLGPGIKDMNLAWSQEKLLCGLMSQPLCKDGTVYLLDKAHGLTAFTLETGDILWRDDHQVTPKDRNPQVSLVWADESKNVAAGLNALGELIFMRLTPEKFEELSRHQVVGKTWANPAFTRNEIFARSDTELTAWRLWE